MQDMLERAVRQLILGCREAYPAVVLVGPRQCGKTTLAQALGGVYFDLEQASEHWCLDLEWDALTAGTDLVILDLEHNIKTVGKEMGALNRKINALEETIIPLLQKKLRYIQDALEQNEREEIFRLKMVKRIQERKATVAEPEQLLTVV
jgi:energy-coupling factor transporter ATP-binding protein EcfA2